MDETNLDRIIIRFHEIAIKGDNRNWFEERLAINIRKNLQRVHGKGVPVEVIRHYGRMEVRAPWSLSTREALARTFGLSNFSLMTKAPTERDALISKAIQEVRQYITQYGMPKSFRVKTRRTEKALPESSTEIDWLVGSAVHTEFPGIKVDLTHPELTVGIELRYGESFFWTEKIAGVGGLPVGCNAPVLSLISGGIDSPVATIQTLKRGSATAFLHFYGAPFVGEEVLNKVEDLVRIVNRYQADPLPLHVIPFGKIQEKIALVSHPKVRTILYRRMMIRIANRVAKNMGLHALITGESIGQVASQTVENIAIIDRVSELPIFRPLIGSNKDEIIALAQKYGTFETSIQPGLDCCTLFADRHPSLRAQANVIEEQEALFPVEELIEEALAGLTRTQFRAHEPRTQKTTLDVQLGCESQMTT